MRPNLVLFHAQTQDVLVLPAGMGLITAKDGKAEALVPRIEKAITALVASSDVEKIWKKYEGSTPFNP